jgi:hypothetical protein
VNQVTDNVVSPAIYTTDGNSVTFVRNELVLSMSPRGV